MTEQTNPCVTEAAKWLATTPDHLKPHPLVPELKKRFAITTLEATQATAEARLIQARSN